MVSTPEIHVLLLIADPTTAELKAELALAYPQRTVYPQIGHRSTIDQAQVNESPLAKDGRPNHWATPPTTPCDP